jgi:hypothetical protein
MTTLHWTDIWTQEELEKLLIHSVSDFMKCNTQHSVEAAVEFAKFLNAKGLNSDNYPIFLQLLKHENHNVIEALLGDADAFAFFREIQPNYYLIDFCFTMLRAYAVGGVYERTLALIFGILYRNYHRAREGYSLYPLSIENLNALGKFLDKEKNQNEGVNRFILDILADIAEYTSQFEEDEEVNVIASHAVAIRNAFFDRRREMSSVMPPEILTRADYRKTSINPRKTKPFTAANTKN